MRTESATILLAEDTSSAIPVVHGKTIVVHSKQYAPPAIDGAAVMEFGDFAPRCRDAVKDFDSLVFVGLSKTMTPSNRTKDVWELLFNQTPQLHKVSVDNLLFVSEPWRLWFHFGLVGAKYRDYTYSYIAESHHKSFIDGIRDDDPFAADEVLKWSAGVISSSYAEWFSEPDVTIVSVSESARAEYAAEKQAAFDEETAVNRIIDRLTAIAEKSCPVRYIPPPHQLFKTRAPRILATDLPVDTWLVGRLNSLIELTNAVARENHYVDGRVQAGKRTGSCATSNRHCV